MKPSKFAYLAPTTLDEATSLLHANQSEAKLLAGGQSLVPLMNLRLAAPPTLIDLNGVQELDYIREQDDRICIGALTRHHALDVSATVRSHCPLLSYASSNIGFLAIRHRGTIGGSLAHADPAAELPTVALALDAEIRLQSQSVTRELAVNDFLKGPFTTALNDDELLVEVRFPKSRECSGWALQEFARKAGDFAMICVAVVVDVIEQELRDVSVSVGGLRGRPFRVSELESSLEGLNVEDTDGAKNRVAACFRSMGPTSLTSSEDAFRKHLSKVLVDRALQVAIGRAGGRQIGR